MPSRKEKIIKPKKIAAARAVKSPEKTPIKKVSAVKPAKKASPVKILKKRTPRPPAKKKTLSAKTPIPSELPVKIEFKEPTAIRSFKPGPADEDCAALFPGFYNETCLTAMARDPHWLYVYWEVESAALEEMKRKLGGEYSRSSTILRVYDVTDILFNGNNAHRCFDINLSRLTNSWYIHTGEAGRAWIIDIGVLTAGGNFYLFARSNTTKTPPDRVSDLQDEAWMLSEEISQKLFPEDYRTLGTAAGHTSSRIIKRLQKNLSLGGSSSWSGAPGGKTASPLFWLRAGTEIIIYGATEPDAAVSINGKPVKLEKDGAFSVRFSLSDGTQAVNVEAVSRDGRFLKGLTIDVSKKTEGRST